MSEIVIPPIIAVDSMVLVWGLRSAGSESQNKLAVWFLRQLQIHKVQVILPSIVVSEYLTPFDTAAHKEVVEILSKRFIIKPFDSDCASLAADLFHVGQKLRHKNNDPGNRPLLRADAMIVATAKVFGAKTFYGGDEDCIKLANEAMLGEAIPTPTCDIFGHYLDL